MHHGHTGKRKCLPRDNSNNSQESPLFLKRFDVGRKGVVIYVPLHALKNILVCKTVH